MFAFDRNNVCAAIVLLLVSICAMPHAACAQVNEEVVVAFLGHLHCHRVTSGGGNDDLNATYGVLVGYTDGTYRVWGDYFHYRKRVDSRYRQGPLITHPLFVHSFLRTRQPTSIDTVVDARRVDFLRVVICLVEYDSPPLLAQGLSGRQDLTATLNGFPWDQHRAELRDGRNDSIFGRTVLLASQTSYDDVIGRHEIVLSAGDLSERGNVYNAAAAVHLTDVRMPPQHTRRDFHLRGDGSDYRGSIWLTRGDRSIYKESLAGVSGVVPIREGQMAFLLHNQTPYDVNIQIRLEGGRSVLDRLKAKQRKQYSPGNRPGEVPEVTVFLPDGFVAGDADFARFRAALRRVPPLHVHDGYKYHLQFRDTTVAWVRQQ
jgi:hypothetical protein